MNELIFYLLKSGISLILLYAVYGLFLSRDTFFNINRVYLVASVLFSLLFPLLPVTLSLSTDKTFMVMLDPIVISASKINPVVDNNLETFQIIGIIYLTGMAIFSVRFLFQIGQLILMVQRTGVTRQQGLNIVLIDRNYAPFSFFSLIFINRKELNEKQVQEIIDHELVHVNQRHSLDLILMEIMTIIQWFNPAVWFYRHSIKTVHEYLADEGVLLKGHNARDYQKHLFAQSIGIQVNDLTNNFNHSLIKKRIVMMTKTKSTLMARLKLLTAMPVAFMLVVAFTASPTLNMLGQSEQKFPDSLPDSIKEKLPEGVKYEIIEGRESGHTNNKPVNDDVYTLTEILPEFPGGKGAMMTYLAGKIEYPKTAKEAGKEGTVYVSFIVEKDGSITNANVLRGFDEACDNVALDAVMSMPKWDPGREKGEPVRVQYNLPMKFTLDAEKKIKDANDKSAPPPPPKKEKR